MWILLIVAGVIVYEKLIVPVGAAASNVSKIDPNAANRVANSTSGLEDAGSSLLSAIAGRISSSGGGGASGASAEQTGELHATATTDIGAAGDVGFGDAAASVSNGLGDFSSSFSNWFNG